MHSNTKDPINLYEDMPDKTSRFTAQSTKVNSPSKEELPWVAATHAEKKDLSGKDRPELPEISRE